jgi:polysaccharide biosynthesis/export protein
VDSKGQAVYVENPAKDTAVYRHRIKPDDRIVINFLNNYDLEKQNLLSNSGDRTEEKSFLVADDGTVTLPIIGRVELKGLTRQEAARKLEEQYSKYIKNPIIDVSIINLSVSVLGEVRNPGTYMLDRENTNLVELLAMAGGVTDNGRLKRLRIIRGDLKAPEVIYIDLRQLNSLQSDKLIIHDKDIVYVEPTAGKKAGAPLTALSPYFILLTTLSSLFIAISVFSR